ncbi:MAG: MFS transporter [Syntrophomonadaceae bacterium]|nr:MFS transporter [Syntrophomonadaceae bacterium]
MKQVRIHRHWLVLASVSMGTVLMVTNGTIVGVALPTMAYEMQTDLAVIQWVVLAYLLALSALLPITGRLSDMFGRKLMYCTGLIIVVIGAIACAVAPNLGWLIAARVLMALGAAMPMSNGQAIVTSVFPAKERGMALGITGSMVAIGTMAGPVIGGFLIQWAGWPAVFLVNIPLGFVAFAAAAWLLPKDNGGCRQESFDFAGAGLFIAATVALLLAVAMAPVWGTGPATWLAAITALGAMLLFVARERRTQYPLIDLDLFRIRLFSLSIGAAFLSFVAMSATAILTPFYLQDILGFPPSSLGLLLLPYPVVLCIVAPVSGYFSDKIPGVFLTTTGLLINGAGLIWLASIDPSQGLWVILTCMSILGFGMGLFLSPNNSAVMGSVPEQRLSVANGMNSLIRNLGMVIGTAVAVGVFTAARNDYLISATAAPVLAQTGAFLAGWQAALNLSAAAALTAAVVSLLRLKAVIPAAEGK